MLRRPPRRSNTKFYVAAVLEAQSDTGDEQPSVFRVVDSRTCEVGASVVAFAHETDVWRHLTVEFRSAIGEQPQTSIDRRVRYVLAKEPR